MHRVFSTHTCSFGCSDNYDCAYGYHCSAHVCVKSQCEAGADYCKGSSNECYDNMPCNTGTGCCTPPESPIVIDVEGDGFLMTDSQEGVVFDIAANGKPLRLAWTAADSDDAWLALDRNGNGRIDSGLELFGNHTPQAGSERPKNGFEALALFDRPAYGGNGDGIINAGDAIFSRLVLWQDKNHNGISEAEEMKTLSHLEVTGISLDYKESRWVDVHGNEFRYRARVDRSRPGRGAYKWAFDVFLVVAVN